MSEQTLRRPGVISLVAAMSRNRVIGVENRLPWHLPADLKHFSRLTRGHAVVMGRRTWESMPGALPQRRNIVISRRPDYAAAGAEVVGSLGAALDRVAEEAEAFVIGGEQIYRLALPAADRVYLTVVQTEVVGDAYFPEMDAAEWTLTDSRTHEADAANALGCVFQTWERVRGSGAA